MRKFRLKLKCKNLPDYTARFAARYEGEFFVPTAKPSPANEAVEVQLVFEDGEVQVDGEAIVVRAEEQKGKPGLILRFTDQNTRATGAFVALGDDEEISEFDKEEPTRSSGLSKEIAETLRDDEPEIVITSRAVTVEAPQDLQEADPSGEGLGVLMGESEAAVPTRAPAAGNPATVPKTPATAPKTPATVTVPKTPATVEPSQQAATADQSDASEAADEAAPGIAHDEGDRTGIALYLWLAGGALIAVAAVLAVAVFSGDKTPEVVTQAPPPSAAITAADEAERAKATAKADAEEKVRSMIDDADKRATAGRLTGPDSALEGLLAARELAPENADVSKRLGSLADKFEELATLAVDAGNLAEAATHMQAGLLADPSRTELADRMKRVEEQVRNAQTPGAP